MYYVLSGIFHILEFACAICYSMAGVVLVATPVDFALPGFTLRVGIIRRPWPVGVRFVLLRRAVSRQLPLYMS